MINEVQFRRQKNLSFVVTLFHLAFAVFLFVKGILYITRLNVEYKEQLLQPGEYRVLAIVGIIAIFLIIMLFKLSRKNIQLADLRKITAALNFQCILGLLLNFWFGRSIYLKDDVDAVDGIILMLILIMIFFEIIYLLNAISFMRRTKQKT